MTSRRLAMMALFCLCGISTQEVSAWYAPQLGRWLTRDPWEYYGSPWNLYQYTNSCPIVYLDADGLKRRKLCVHPPASDPFEEGIAAKCDKNKHWEDIECSSIKDCADKMKGNPDDCITQLELGGHGRFDGGAIIIGPKVGPNRGDIADDPQDFEDLLGDLNFCPDCKIQLDSCNLGNDPFMEMVQDATDEGCQIKGPTGELWCDETGRCWLPPDKKGPGGDPNKWKILPRRSRRQ